MVAIAMKRDLDVCLSDGLPCSRFIKGVGFGVCVKSLDDTVCLCPRFSDVCLLECSIREKDRFEVAKG